jgi:hypothetical protein
VKIKAAEHVQLDSSTFPHTSFPPFLANIFRVFSITNKLDTCFSSAMRQQAAWLVQPRVIARFSVSLKPSQYKMNVNSGLCRCHKTEATVKNTAASNQNWWGNNCTV